MSEWIPEPDADEQEFLEHFRAPLTATRHKGAACPAPRLLRALAAGVLPEETGIAEHVERCSFCQSLVRDLQDLEPFEPTIQEESRIHDRISKVIQKSRHSVRFWIPLAAATAGVAILAAALQWTFVGQRPDSAPLQTAANLPAPVLLPLEKPAVKVSLPDALVFRSEPSNQAKLMEDLRKALEPYKADNFGDAAQRLELFTKQYPRSIEGRFYLGVSLVFLSRPADAAAELEKAKELNVASFARDVSWYLSIAYQRAGQDARSIIELQPLCAEPGNYQSQACETLKKTPKR